MGRWSSAAFVCDSTRGGENGFVLSFGNESPADGCTERKNGGERCVAANAKTKQIWGGDFGGAAQHRVSCCDVVGWGGMGWDGMGWMDTVGLRAGLKRFNRCTHVGQLETSQAFKVIAAVGQVKRAVGPGTFQRSRGAEIWAASFGRGYFWSKWQFSRLVRARRPTCGEHSAPSSARTRGLCEMCRQVTGNTIAGGSIIYDIISLYMIIHSTVEDLTVHCVPDRFWDMFK